MCAVLVSATCGRRSLHLRLTTFLLQFKIPTAIAYAGKQQYPLRPWAWKFLLVSARCLCHLPLCNKRAVQ